MAKDYKNMSITQLVIERENICRDLDKIKNDSDYIRRKTAQVFGGKPARDHSEELNAIINNYL